MATVHKVCKTRPLLYDRPPIPQANLVPIKEGFQLQLNFKEVQQSQDGQDANQPSQQKKNLKIYSINKKHQSLSDMPKIMEDAQTSRSKNSTMLRESILQDGRDSFRISKSQAKDSRRSHKNQEAGDYVKESKFEIGSETSSYMSKALKEQLSGTGLLKSTRKSQGSLEYFDLGGSSFKNYKYEKLNLARTELNFMAEKPLDFAGKSFGFQHCKLSNYRNTEIAIENQKKQRDIIQFGSSDTKLSNEIDNQVLASIKSKIQKGIVSQFDKEKPFEKIKIQRQLKQLDEDIKERNSLYEKQLPNPKYFSKLSNSTAFKFIKELPSISDANESSHTSRFSSASSPNLFSEKPSRELSQQKSYQWISPLLKHEAMRHTRNGSDSILKNELMRGGTTANQSQEKIIPQDVKIFSFNQILKGKGKSMSSITDKIGSRDPMKNMQPGEVVKALNKKSQYLRIVEEYNRLLEIDKNKKALSNTKRISTKIYQKLNDAASQDNLTGEQQNCLSQNTFIEETIFFKECLRQEKEIVDRIIYGIKSNYNAISFESYLHFYQIFVFENTPENILARFIAKILLFNPQQIIQATTLSDLLTTLRLLSSHPCSQDAHNLMLAWDIALQSSTKIKYDLEFHINEFHIREFLEDNTFDCHEILKLLFL